MISKWFGYLKKTLISLREGINSAYHINFQGGGCINYIDIGSLRGLTEPWRSNANQIRFLLNFDPNEKPRRTKNSFTYNTAVWDADETRPFYITKGRGGSGSSLLKPNYQYVRTNFESLKKQGPKDLADSWFERSEIVKTIDIHCLPLDQILEDEFPNTDFHFLKVDAQGAESNIIKGAHSFLSEACLGIHIELYKIPLYESAVLFGDVVAYLEDRGFTLVKMFPPSGTFHSQRDCLFLKESESGDLLSVIRKVYNLE